MKRNKWTNNLILCIFFGFLLMPTISTLAQEDEPASPLSDYTWIFTGGPRGGIGYDIRIHPQNYDVIWVTDAFAGAHQSIDGGQTWRQRSEGIDARVGMSGDAIPVFSLTIDPNNSDIIWAGAQGVRGVYKSVDGGMTWMRKDHGIVDRPNMEFRGFTVDPSDSNIVYCGGNYIANHTTNDQRGFIYKTIDGGESWTLLLEPKALVRWIIVDPSDTNIIYASTGIFDRFAIEPEGVLKSYDGGQNWEPINNGFTSLSVGALAMHPTDPLTLIAGTGKSDHFKDEPQEIYGGVFLTHDGGQTWRQVDPIRASGDISTRFSAVAFAPSDPNIVYADGGNLFLRSIDGGENWEIFDVGPSLAGGFLENRGTPIALTVHPINPNYLFMNAYDGGVFISEDGGKTWQDSSEGYSGAQVWGIAIDPENPAYVFSASKNGVHVSFDAGNTWHGRITEGWINNISAVAIDSNNGTNTLIGREIDARVWLSNDGGFTWNLVLGPLGEDTPTGRRTIYDIEFAPSSTKIIYTVTGIGSLTVSPPKGTMGPGVFKSMDGGQTWQEINQGLENTTLNIFDVAIHPKDPDIVYIGTLDHGVYKTANGGESWSRMSSGLWAKEIRAVAIDPQNTEVVYAGAERGGMWKSQDEGASWAQISSGLPPEASVRSIVIDPMNPGTLYIADQFSGVFRSKDGGANWESLNSGLAMRSVHDLAISTDGRHLYAATDGMGVFRMDIAGNPPLSLSEITASEYLGIEEDPIEVDGLSKDWAGRVVLREDPAGDSEAGYLDFSKGYAFIRDEMLYFLVETLDPSAPVAQFDIIFRADGRKLLISVFPGFNKGHVGDITTDFEAIGEAKFSRFAFNESFEGRIDLRDLGSPENIHLDYINVMVGECCEHPGWRAADVWNVGGDTPLESESWITPTPTSTSTNTPTATSTNLPPLTSTEVQMTLIISDTMTPTPPQEPGDGGLCGGAIALSLGLIGFVYWQRKEKR